MGIFTGVIILGLVGYLVYRFLFKKKGKSCCSQETNEME